MKKEMEKEKSCKTCRFVESCTDKLPDNYSFCKDWIDGGTYQGGFSDKIWKQEVLQSYIKDCKGLVFGYIGHENRCKEIDTLIEITLKSHHIHCKGIAERLTGAMGRHFADKLPYKDMIEAERQVERYLI